MEYYLSHGDSLDPPTPEIEPVIHVALRVGHTEAVEQLIAHGANLFLRNPKGELPIQVAIDPVLRERMRDVMVTQASKAKGAAKKAMEADAQIAKEVCKEKINELFLREAKRHPLDGREARLRALVAEGADVNVKDQDGVTALHVAARIYEASLINALLAMGADPFATTSKGERPMDLVKVLSREDLKEDEKATREALRAGMVAWEHKQLDAAAKPAKPAKPKGEKKPGRDKGL